VEADADQAATWTRPQDLPFDPQNPRRGLGNLRSDGFMVLMADGSVRMVTKDIDDEVVRRMMLRDDGLPVPSLDSR
jgi:prepilin-type processing-associated H-X9-DG protein